MSTHIPMVDQAELQPLLELTQRVGSDPLLTQASTGNSSVKVDGVLWIKASGRWMVDATQNDILIPLDLNEVVTHCLRRGVDPAARYPGASLETAMHAALPHRMVFHVHCVDTIAWAVRADAEEQLERRLAGLNWKWIPYVASGLPLAREIERAISSSPEADVFILGNHGLVVGGDSAKAVERLLDEVRRRLAIAPRKAHPADYAMLMDLAADAPWDLPDDNCIHGLGTDPVSQAILSGGLLYPCQAIFSDQRSTELFRPIPCPGPGEEWLGRYLDRPFAIVEGRGVLVGRSMTAPELAMLSGLAQVVQRLGDSQPLRYLSAGEIAEISGQAAYRYKELATVGQSRQDR